MSATWSAAATMPIDKVIDVEGDEEYIQKNNGEDPMSIVNHHDSFDEDFLGKIVSSEVEAFNLYNDYAIRMGFSIRKGQKRYSIKNILRQINYMCSKEGFRLDGDHSEVKMTNRLETRTGCKAKIRFTLQDDGMWKVSCFDREHNHELAKSEWRQFLRSNRKISEAHVGVIKSMVSAGIRTTNTYSYLAEEVGGSQNVGFTKRDCYNLVNKEKNIMLEAGDAQSLIDHFKRKQVEDPMFFFTVQVDQENRMTNFFWRDGRSRIDYEAFGDVVVFDTTYRTNRYNMICAPFVGVNNHRNNVLFGCAFLLNETTNSFIWLFETFLESIGSQKPKTIFTDQAQAMSNAIEKVFPETCHRLCIWHISMNAAKNLGSHYGNPEFKRMFNNCLYGCETELEFQSSWDDLIAIFNLAENTWLKTLYILREKWCSAFSQDTFSARIRSSQRSESTNNVFHHMSSKTISLTQFVHQYDKATEEMRSKEAEENFRCNQGVPSRAAKSSGILNYAATMYTRKMFILFEKEFIASLAVTMHEVGVDGTVHTFELNEEGHKRVYIVRLNSSGCIISCSCKMFESIGMLCRHALRVINVKNITQIPAQYILKRWTKDAKKGLQENEYCGSLHVKDKQPVTLRRNNLMRLAYNILSKGAEMDSASKIAMQKLREMEELIDKEIIKSKGDVNKVSNEVLDDDTLAKANGKDCLFDEIPVLNPSCVRPKGISNARMKNCLEKQKKKASKNPITSKKMKQPKRVGPSPIPSSVGPSPIPSNIGLSPILNNAGPSHTSLQAPNSSSFLNSFDVPVNLQNQLDPTMILSTTSARASLPPSNQDPNSTWTYCQPNFSFMSMLQSNDYMPHFYQNSSTSFATHKQDPKE